MPKKSASTVDVYVGQRIRQRRMMMGYSQEELGRNLDLTFQQIQKYEKGVNRVGAGRLFLIASILGVPVAYFFPEEKGFAMPDQAMFVPTAGEIVLLQNLREMAKGKRNAIIALVNMDNDTNDKRDAKPADISAAARGIEDWDGKH